MLLTATSANVRFLQVVQLLAPPQTLLTHLAEKIPFINSKKIILGVNFVRTNIRFSGV